MAESDNDSFILIQVNDNNGDKTIEQQLMFNNAQLTRSILTNKSNNGSIDGWSEISAPSLKSNKSIPKQTGNSFNVFSGTYLQNSAPMIGSIHNNNNNNNNNNNTNTNSDKGYFLINTGSQENVPVFSSNSTTNDINDEGQNGKNNNNMNMNNNNNINNNSIGSIGSRVPFSWAEITKIQPQFHNENNKEVHKPKVFDQTPKIRTRYRSKSTNSNDNDNQDDNKKVASKSISKLISSNNDDNNNDDDNNTMSSIPESYPSATKSDLGRRVRRSGKRGSRLKYPNNRRGTKRNWRKKNQK